MRKYRLFGIINPIDVLLVAGIVALVWGLHIFSMPQQAAAEGGQIIHFTIEFPNRPEGFHKGIEPGPVVLDGVRGLHIGYVVRAFAEPAMEDAPDEDNAIFRRVPVEGRESTHVVIEARANITTYATEIGQFHVRVNMPIFPRSRDFAGSGIVSRIEVVR
ncbi:MAG: DUF4330 domain-containing protein [Defluviitaleaceae bacterium]|nr:DUF4330 domain-containing protein [Defluviitaleaceae bacterium]